jgi:hypothetical protein
MNATLTRAINLAMRLGSVKWVSSKLNPPDFKALKNLCKALHNMFYAKYIVMQSHSKIYAVNQPVISQLYSTTLHNNITSEDFLTIPEDSDSSPIYFDRRFQGQVSYMPFQAFRVSA